MVEQTYPGIPTKRQSKLTLVDLAGMESSKSVPEAAPGANPKELELRRTEAKKINQSNSALARVLDSLGSGGVPQFREYSLTKLLEDSISNNSKTSIIVTVRGEEASTSESMGTLHFAQTAKTVQISSEANEHFKPELDATNANLEALQAELMAKRRAYDVAKDAIASAGAEGAVMDTAQSHNALSRQLKQAHDDYLECREKVLQIEPELSAVRAKIKGGDAKLQAARADLYHAHGQVEAALQEKMQAQKQAISQAVEVVRELTRAKEAQALIEDLTTSDSHDAPPMLSRGASCAGSAEAYTTLPSMRRAKAAFLGLLPNRESRQSRPSTAALGRGGSRVAPSRFPEPSTPSRSRSGSDGNLLAEILKSE